MVGRLVQRHLLRRTQPREDVWYPDWQAILDTNRPLWDEARQRAQRTGSPRVLVATSVGGYSPGAMIESLLAVALTLRGAAVSTLLCDAALPACFKAEYGLLPDPRVIANYELQDRLCASCTSTGKHHYGPLQLDDHQYREFITHQDREQARALASTLPLAEIQDYRHGPSQLALGEHAYAGALRYFARGTLDGERRGEAVLRRYLEAALLTRAAVESLLDRQHFEVVCFNHGLYVPQGVMAEVCRARSVRLVNWNPAYRTSCFIFSHQDSYHHTLLDEPTGDWEQLAWTPEMDAQISTYLKSRWHGSRDWIWFHERPDENFVGYAAAAGLDLDKPIIGLLTNVMWDAQLHYRANAFPSMLAWLQHTIAYFASRPDLQLLIRVHPAEIRGTLASRQPIIPEIKKLFPTLPPNVFTIAPESAVSTYAAMHQCNAVLIYGTKTGVELTSVGIPVIVAGEAWIRNKGLTLDASSPADYTALLDRLPLPHSEADAQRAKKYAYHFFFRRMIPVGCTKPTNSWPPYHLEIEQLGDLLPGNDPGLDLLCEGILNGTPFTYPAELLGVHDA